MNELSVSSSSKITLVLIDSYFPWKTKSGTFTPSHEMSSTSGSWIKASTGP